MDARTGGRLGDDFSNVDRAEAPGVHVEYLDRVRSDPRWQQWKSETIELMELSPGERCLDLGCGTGEDVVAMADHLEGSGLAIGVDRSVTMAGEATRRHDRPDCSFVVADAASLPFTSASFDAARVERTLQHLADPGLAVVELARILRNGGRLVAFEPDWETLVLSSPLEVTGRAIFAWRIGQKPSRTVGRRIALLMVEAGLTVQGVSGRVVTITSYDRARYAFSLESNANAAARAGVISQSAADAWLSSLRAADVAGGFVAAVTNLIAVARKPGRAPRPTAAGAG
jgi:ubiquinone/menaquinone biosynthesis C-methylase UbiE